MLKFILVSLTLTVAFATLGFNIDAYQGANLTPLDLQCVIGKGAEYFIIESRNEDGNINANFSTAYQYLKGAGIKNVDTLLSICDSYTADEMCSSVAKNLPAGFDGKVWLSIDTDDDCWKNSYG